MQVIIDDQKVIAFPGETIMQAARRADIFIPGLCFSEATDPTNSCRLCMVEIQERGKAKLVAACAFPVKEGLVVTTENDKIKRIRDSILKLMYAQAPENPTILSLMERYSVLPEKKIIEKDGQCILCGLCIKTCKKLGASAITTVNRGITKKVSTPYDRQAMTCIGCASCARACPTNCIKVEDNEEGRTIWNKKFKWIRCEICGTIVTTDKHYKASNGDGPVICPVCKKKNLTDVFAETLGER